jgi:hypothetical protein
MGTQPALFRLYTQLAFVFPLTETKLYSTLVSTVTEGLKRLSDNFPWVSGQVINVTTDSNRLPIYKIRRSKSYGSYVYATDGRWLSNVDDGRRPMGALPDFE